MKIHKARRTLQRGQTSTKRSRQRLSRLKEIATGPSKKIKTPMVWWYSARKGAHYLCLAVPNEGFLTTVRISTPDGIKTHVQKKCLTATAGYPTQEQATQIQKEIRAATQRLKLLRLRKKEI